MTKTEAKNYVEAELAYFIGRDMMNPSNQHDFEGVFNKVMRYLHRNGFVTYNDTFYDLTLERDKSGFDNNIFYPCWVYNPRV